MNEKQTEHKLIFYSTPRVPCSYLKGRFERRVFTSLGKEDPKKIHSELSLIGFRRSYGIIYKPACGSCRECIPVRVMVKHFVPSKSQKRVYKKNEALSPKIVNAKASLEQYEIFSTYQFHRHLNGEMSKMSFSEYKAMIEETPIETWLVEFRDQNSQLISALLFDKVEDGFSAVYSFYDPEKSKSSLGTHMVLWLIEQARLSNLNYVYLGFWIEGAKKMTYKRNFQPIEGFYSHEWVKL